MRITRRRRFDAVLLGVGALVTGAVAAIGGVAGDTERVTGMWVGASLDDSGGGAIVEVIDYDFGLAQGKHGIFREIPSLSTDDVVGVDSSSAPDGIAAKTPEFIDRELGIRVKIGDPNITVTGRHRYEIKYDLPTLAAGGHLEWDAVGTGWDVPVKQSDVHVVAPWRFTGLGCSKGVTGSRGGCALTQPEPGHLVVRVGSLDGGEGVTIVAGRGEPLAAAPRLPAPPLDAPPDPGAGLALPAAVATVAGLGASITAAKLVRRKGRERVGAGGVADAAWAGSGGGPTGETLLDHEDLAAMATTDFAPPEGITAPMGGIILSEGVRPEHKVAWLLEAAIAGDVELIEAEGEPVRLVHRDTARAETRPILHTIFSGREEVELGSYDASFATGWSALDGQLKAWQRQSGLWDPAGDRRHVVIRVLGVLAAIGGLVGVGGAGALAARYGKGWLPVVAVTAAIVGLGLAAAVRGWELKVRTPAGSGWWLRVESFRRFLAGSEAFHAEEAAKRGLLREYTAWAVAVGEIDRWARAVSASSAIPQDAGMSYVHMAPLLAASTSSASTAPSSSSSGGGGGGSVGGGGGGGGGGSW
jgi:hypothetical protein